MSHLMLALVLTSTPADDARAALAPFKKTLLSTLTKALETSPDGAIEVCSVKAPELARAASSERVTVGRSALKLRNDANAPKAWLAPVMKELAAEQSGTAASRTVTLPDGTVGYAEAIWTGPMCLTCHGEALAPSIDAKLKARYPKDTARGFKPGEFRGVFWAEVKPTSR